jgi:tetratricopeptide (TPR) repeat protein
MIGCAMSRNVHLEAALFLIVLALPMVAEAAVADLPCGRCHPAETLGYASTPMALSLSVATPRPAGDFTHALSKTRFSVGTRGPGAGAPMWQRLDRDGFSGEYAPAYAIGSGTHAIAYLIDLRGHLFQSPICFYKGRGWDMAPGYERNPEPDFLRPVTPECLFCHVGRAQPVTDSLNRYEDPPITAEGIGCDRCHGAAEAHLRNPLPGSIINPAKLPVRARNSVCEQCHLSGEARVANPGKRLSDFQPGEDLENTFAVYVFEGSLDPAQSGALKVISQAQQLALSTCARRSAGKLWCGTCHDPHRQPTDAQAWFRSRCLSCHGEALLRTHSKPNDDCIGCHMPQRPVSDGGHTVFTDHRISRRPSAQSVAAGIPNLDANRDLVAWHEPAAALEQRNLGLAEIEVGERTRNLALVSRGAKRLTEYVSTSPNDPAVLTSIGQVMLGAGDAGSAAVIFQRAIEMEPNDPSHYLHAAMAWRAAHDSGKAIENAEKALRLDPMLEQPYRLLADIYREDRQPAMVHMTYERYLKAFPESIEAQRDVKESALPGHGSDR